MAGALNDVVGAGEQRASAEGENDGVGMQGPQSAIAEIRRLKLRLGQINCAAIKRANRHPDDSPDDRHKGKTPYHGVVVNHRDGGGFRTALHLQASLGLQSGES